MATDTQNDYLAGLSELAQTLELVFPMRRKADLVAQVTAQVDEIRIGGHAYPADFAAELIPDFFFPISNLADLRHKAAELMASRGLIRLGQVSSA